MSLAGERLRQAREARGISTYQIEIDTRIRATVIEALEQGIFEHLPPEPFLRGLIRTYSTYLGVDADEMLALHVADITPPPIPRTPIPPPPIAPPPPPVTEPEPVLEETARRKIAPPPLMPKPSDAPERLLPPETLDAIGTQPGRFSLAHFTRRPPSLPVIAAMAAVALIICLVIGLLVSAIMVSLIVQAPSATISTRVPPTRTLTPRPGTLPTSIPTIDATVPSFPTFPGNPTATLRPATRRAGAASAGLELDVTQVTQTIKIQVGVDGVMVFDGTIAPGNTLSWNARNTLYMHIENPRGAIISLNGNSRLFAPRNFAETRALERQWSLNDRGTPISEAPVPPPVVTPKATPRINPIPTTPTPTLTPYS